MARKTLADKAVLIAIGNGVQSLGTSLIGIFLVRLFPDQETYGSYRQVWLVIQTLLPLFLLGLPASVYFFFPRLVKGERRRFVLRAIWLLVTAGAVFSTGMYVFAGEIARVLGNPPLVPVIRAFCLYPLFTAPSMLLFPFLISTDQHYRGIAFNLGFFVSQTILIIALAGAGLALGPLFGALVVLAALRLLYALYEVHRQTRDLERQPLTVTLRENFEYSIPVGLSAMTAVLGARMDKLVVSAALGTVVYAVYDVGAVEFPGITLAAMAANTVMHPHIAGLHHTGNRGEIYRFWRESFRKMSLVIAPMAVYLAFFAREFIEFLYTAEWTDATPVFQIYLILSLFRNASPGTILNGVGLTRVVFYGAVVFLVLNLALNVLFVRWIGVLGPPLATVAAMACLQSYYALRARQYLAVRTAQMFPVWTMSKALLLSGAAGLVAFPIRMLDLSRLGTLLAGGIVFAVLYVVVGVLTRVIRREDVEIARRWVTLRALR